MSQKIPGMLEIQDNLGVSTRIILDGDDGAIYVGNGGRDGDVVLQDDTGKERLRIGRRKIGKPPNTYYIWGLWLMDGNKVLTRLSYDGYFGLTGDGRAGDLCVNEKDGHAVIRLRGEDRSIVVWDPDKRERIRLGAEEGAQVTQYGSERAGHFKIENPTNGNPAIEGSTNGSGNGVAGHSAGKYKSGVYGDTNSIWGYGVYGKGYKDTERGMLGAYVEELHPIDPCGVYGRSDHPWGHGVVGFGPNEGVSGYSTDPRGGTGVAGTSDEGDGVAGGSLNGVGVWGWSGASSVASDSGIFGYPHAGYFHGDVGVLEDFWVGGVKQFRIDHPLDPAGKYLAHSSVESAEQLNLYSGNAVLEADGEVWVSLPDWFEALNTDFRYQLTAMGAPAPTLHVAEEISNNRFRIAGGRTGMRVSWQVAGVRKDAYAKAHPMRVEIEKREAERGTYLHPIEHGLSEDNGISYYQKVRRLRERRLVKPKVEERESRSGQE